MVFPQPVGAQIMVLFPSNPGLASSIWYSLGTSSFGVSAMGIEDRIIDRLI